MACRLLGIHIITIAFILSSQLTLKESGCAAHPISLNGIEDILFGKIWKFGEYCEDDRNDSRKIDDDIEIEKFFNGSALGSIQANEPNDGRTLADKFDELVHLGIKVRTHTSLTCAINSWGYAGLEVFENSQGSNVDEAECRWEIDQLYQSYKLLTASRTLNQTSLTKATRPNLVIGASLTKTLVDDWLHLNTYGRTPAGQVHINHHLWPGDYNQCEHLNEWRYCYGALRMSGWIASNDSHLMAIRVGLCLPATCDNRLASSQEHLGKLLELVSHNLPKEPRYQLIDIHCPPSADSPYLQPFTSNLSKLFGLLALVWLTMLIYATVVVKIGIVPVYLREKSAHITEMFDLVANWDKLQQSSDEQSQLVGLNAAKVILMNWLVCSHTFLLMQSYLLNLQVVRDTFTSSFIGAALIQGQNIPPAFFLISGILVGYKWFSGGKKRPPPVTLAGVIKMIKNRYLRLAPMYIVIYAFVKQFGHLISNGPMWDYGVSPQSEIRQCQLESWFVPILMIANFIPPFSHCVLTGWHLANDFHIYFTLPLLWFAYRHSKVTGRLLAVAAFISSHLYHVWILHTATNFSYDQLAMEVYTLGPRYLMDRLSYDYINPFGRVGTYFFGVLLADLIFGAESSCEKSATTITNSSESRRNSSNQRQLPNQTLTVGSHKALGWTRFNGKFSFLFAVGLLLLILTICGPAFMPIPSRFVFGPYRQSLTYPVLRLSVELGWSIMLYLLLSSSERKQRHQKAVCKGYVSPLVVAKLQLVGKESTTTSEQGSENNNSSVITGGGGGGVLAWPLWNRLVKLNYCLMLVHFIIARLLVQSSRQLMVFSWLNLLQLMSGVLVLNYLVCGLVHLMIEMPLTSLVKHWLTRY